MVYLFEETELPPQNEFFSKLSDSPCSEYTHVHAQTIQSIHMWDPFRCKTIADYHDIYLQLNVLLLADCFEKFRKTCLELYSLDPLHYYATPGLAWDAALRMIRVDLQLITDSDMYNFVENSIRDRSMYSPTQQSVFPESAPVHYHNLISSLIMCASSVGI